MSSNRRAALMIWMVMGLTAVLPLATGCSSNPGDTGRTVTNEEMKRGLAQQRRQVLANPNMPPQARAAAMGAMRQGQSSGAQSGRSQKENLARASEVKR